MRCRLRYVMENGLFVQYLSRAARAIREGHRPRPSQQTVASTARIATSTLSKFENQPGAWLVETEVVIAAYAQHTGRTPFEFWEEALSEALSLWRADLNEQDGDLGDGGLPAKPPPPPKSPSRSRNPRTHRSTGSEDQDDQRGTG